MRTTYLTVAAFSALTLNAVAQQTAPGAAPVQATFVISGLHCPPCTTTVESSLRRVKGVQAAQVNWNTKNARVTFDETQISAQEIATAIANTPHMMGGSLKYSGSLALRVDGLNNATTASAAQKALKEVPGVANVWVYSAQGAVAIGFDQSAKVTSKQLIEALAKADITANEFK